MSSCFGLPLALAVGLVQPFTPALAQEAATVQGVESAEHGQYLTDAAGRALYLFESDTRAQGEAQAVVSCADDCLERWPPFHSEGEPRAGEMADAAMLGTVEHDGNTMVTYNGWPLYYFVEDQGPGDTKGHDIEEFGAEWYLISPEGEKVDDD
jgi:predicted lipoprotein with Yx(FWY)xxD motif